MGNTIVISEKQNTYTYTVPVLSKEQMLAGIHKMQRAFNAVCTIFEISPERLRVDHSRRRDVVMARQLIWLIIRQDDPHITLKSMAKFLGNYDHTTVLYGCTSISNCIETDQKLKERFHMAVALYEESESYPEPENESETYNEPI